eukprot:c10674_g1_i1.p1 GENE.c10674_g1_i1~~c10674_g1_i1.p1  ORF type:complete len:487 (+),score=82.33 c10674_g1_i1:46-1461(+)
MGHAEHAAKGGRHESEHTAPRSKTFESERMVGWTDGMLSIFATVMVLPLNVEAEDAEGDESAFVLVGNRYSNLMIFLFAFFLVAQYWELHQGLFLPESRITRISLALNVVFVLAISVMPFSTSLYNHASTPPSICIFYGNMGIIALTRALSSVYARHGMGWDHAFNSFDRFSCFGMMLTSALACGLTWKIGSAVHFFFLAFFLARHALALSVVRKNFPSIALIVDPRTVRRYASRLITYSDGVYAIAATLIILDIPVFTSTVGRPLQDQVVDYVHDQASPLLAFGVCAACLGIMWLVHHELFSMVSLVSPVVYTLNLFHLAAISLMPFCTSILTSRLHRERHSALLAVLVFVIVTVVAALFQVGMTLRLIQLNSGKENELLWKGESDEEGPIGATNADLGGADAESMGLLGPHSSVQRARKRELVRVMWSAAVLPLSLLVGALLALGNAYLVLLAVPISITASAVMSVTGH